MVGVAQRMAFCVRRHPGQDGLCDGRLRRAASCLAFYAADYEIVDDIVKYGRHMCLERVLRQSTNGDGSVVLQGPVTA